MEWLAFLWGQGHSYRPLGGALCGSLGRHLQLGATCLAQTLPVRSVWPIQALRDLGLGLLDSALSSPKASLSWTHCLPLTCPILGGFLDLLTAVTEPDLGVHVSSVFAEGLQFIRALAKML